MSVITWAVLAWNIASTLRCLGFANAAKIVPRKIWIFDYQYFRCKAVGYGMLEYFCKYPYLTYVNISLKILPMYAILDIAGFQYNQYLFVTGEQSPSYIFIAFLVPLCDRTVVSILWHFTIENNL